MNGPAQAPVSRAPEVVEALHGSRLESGPALAHARGGSGLHRFAQLLCGATFLLLVAGGLVTSTGSGLSVPDWPTSYGYNMFTFPPSKWVGGIRFEHTHRLIASVVGFLTIVLAVWLLRREPRRWVRLLGLAALLAVVVQGLLGGLTVILLLPTAISVSHASLAQSYFCLVVAIAVVTSREWQAEQTEPGAPDLARVHRLAVLATAVVFLQLVLGAIMRHAEAGLAIPDFPLAFGRLVPPLDSGKVAIHFAHRLGAILVTIAIALLVTRVVTSHRREARLTRPSLLLLGLVAAQVSLGAATVLTRKEALLTTAHVVTGALILATSLLVALRSYRPKGLGAPAEPPSRERSAEPAPSALSDLSTLVKARLTLMVLVTTGVGFYLASSGTVSGSLLFYTLLGTGLLSGGASALNQLAERDLDRRMVRTADRPIPAGRMAPRSALVVGVGASSAGLVTLALGAGLLTALLGLATIVIYLAAYPPLKRRTSLSTLVGAIPGALPPLMGWAAARGTLSPEAWALFGILFFWQLPHFLAIAWIHRDDYASAGFATLSVRDPQGRATSRHIVGYSVALLALSVTPSILGLAGSVYLFGALALGLAFLALGLTLAARRTRLAARGLFLGSLVYLPLLFALLSIDKL